MPVSQYHNTTFDCGLHFCNLHKGGVCLFNILSASLGYKNVTRERGNHIFNAIYKSLLFNVQLSATRFVDAVACAIEYRCVRKYKV